jgi:hypothetical protein
MHVIYIYILKLLQCDILVLAEIADKSVIISIGSLVLWIVLFFIVIEQI